MNTLFSITTPWAGWSAALAPYLEVLKTQISAAVFQKETEIVLFPDALPLNSSNPLVL
jgi:hypothetical protein